MEKVSRQQSARVPLVSTPIVSTARSLAVFPLILLAALLARMLDQMGVQLGNLAKLFYDKLAFIIVELFKDAWAIYRGRLTHEQFGRNAISNCRKALTGSYK